MEWIRCSTTRQSGRKRAAETAEPPSSRGCSPPLNSRIIIYKKDYKKDYKKLHHHQVGALLGSYLVLVDPFQKSEIGEKEGKEEEKKREKKRKRREGRGERRREVTAN